jgi:crotonobetainyl-CoA:carnitine CoA-transferase CaiB-like acyl-CoA transferase
MSVLSNLKILDLSTLLPGPFATMMLADLGADVLRIEAPGRSDLVRELAPFADGTSTKHAMLNRSKKSIGLDLKKPQAIEIIKKLVQEYDIVVEQFRPGVLDRLGIGYEALKAANPKLIFCSITGYGQTGPYRDRGGHDNNYISISGVNGYSGRAGQPTPLMGTQIADIAGGSMHAVIGLLAAVNHRHLTGEGQYIDVSMTDAMFTLNAMFGSDYLAAGEDPQLEKGWLNGGTFYDYYLTADNRNLSVGSLEPHFFKRLCLTVGGEALLALGAQQDAESQQRFKQALAEAIKQKTLQEWTDLFADKDACVEPVLTFAEACDNPQIQARDMIVEVPVPGGGAQKQIGTAIKFSACRPTYQHIGCELGADNEHLQTLLGLSDEELSTLKAAGIFG